MQRKQQEQHAHRPSGGGGARRTRVVHALRNLPAVAVLLVLAACGIVEDVVGPQLVANPLGIDGRELTLRPSMGSGLGGAGATVQGGFTPAPSAREATGAASQQTRTYSADVGPVPVPDIDASGIPGWFDPDALTVEVGFRSTATVASDLALSGDELPDAIVFEQAAIIELAVVDGSGQPRVEVPPVATPAAASVSLVKVGCTGIAPLRCTYTAQGSLDAFVVPLAVDGGRMDALYGILTGGSPSNAADGRFELAASGALPEDVAITVTLHAPTGILDP